LDPVDLLNEAPGTKSVDDIILPLLFKFDALFFLSNATELFDFSDEVNCALLFSRTGG
jgi:hypothetical protein